jgi:ankyrin repeat protein
MCAADKGYLDVIECIVSFGADLNIKDPKKGNTALILAAKKNKTDICDYN